MNQLTSGEPKWTESSLLDGVHVGPRSVDADGGVDTQ